MCAVTGVVSGFWHTMWIAGVRILASGIVGWRSTGQGNVRLEQDREAEELRQHRVIASRMGADIRGGDRTKLSV